MRKVVLFIAMSLDGYIGDRNGGVSWLGGQDPEGAVLDTYSVFIKSVDTVVMGWKTYHQVVTELSPKEWVYEGLTSYVVTHREIPSADQIIFTHQPPRELVRDLKEKPGMNMWICGGADIIQPLVKADLIDEYHISVIPMILGGGIRLFQEDLEGEAAEIPLQLLRAQTYNGITELVYTYRY